ncbi:hypothetical protein N0B44_19770 [Roseibacterium beibuensis]|uniref:hypothetical protein n=1 Tax=[Roseibacterium] beibuensis TaxID=1193142 RepID=UPI00217EBCF4|nr:hypothetical protein [Roseibacterium beibuensis]MCS6625156.1 hypothetical protein [Roseibacterium beibuensis]
MSDRNDLGRQMADKLHAAERALDAALAEIGDLSALMTRGRVDHGIAAVVGQEALEHVAKCGGSLTKARRALVEGHKQMARDARLMRITWTTLGGPLETKPSEDGPRIAPTGRLREVA